MSIAPPASAACATASAPSSVAKSPIVTSAPPPAAWICLATAAVRASSPPCTTTAAPSAAWYVTLSSGSSEGLSAQRLAAAFAPRAVAVGDPRPHSRATAETLVARTAPDAEHLDPFLLMLRSVPNPRAAEIVRAGIERHVGAHLAARLNGAATVEPAEFDLDLIAEPSLIRTAGRTDPPR